MVGVFRGIYKGHLWEDVFLDENVTKFRDRLNRIECERSGNEMLV